MVDGLPPDPSLGGCRPCGLQRDRILGNSLSGDQRKISGNSAETQRKLSGRSAARIVRMYRAGALLQRTFSGKSVETQRKLSSPWRSPEFPEGPPEFPWRHLGCPPEFAWRPLGGPPEFPWRPLGGPP
eukprot:891737-Pyramimonas_sp.AAC.1